ncbi:uncharacterized protein, partial [Salmo salar]|uniref:Ig-like domain-containing protein n=1 Tax=Salmo salar TaxID=8030 RepID=A0ABM3EEP2_SALSA
MVIEKLPTWHTLDESTLFPRYFNKIALNQCGIDIELTYVSSGHCMVRNLLCRDTPTEREAKERVRERTMVKMAVLGLLGSLLYLLTGVSGETLSMFSRVGDDVSLPCNNVVYPNCSSTTWIYNRDGTAIELVGLGKVKKQLNNIADRLSLGSNCSLHVSDVRAEDAGQYTCQQYLTETGLRHGADAPVHLSVLTSSPPPIQILVLHVAVGVAVGAAVCVVAAVIVVHRRRTHNRMSADDKIDLTAGSHSNLSTNEDKHQPAGNITYASILHFNQNPPQNVDVQGEDAVTYSSVKPSTTRGRETENSADPSSLYSTVSKPQGAKTPTTILYSLKRNHGKIECCLMSLAVSLSTLLTYLKPDRPVTIRCSLHTSDGPGICKSFLNSKVNLSWVDETGRKLQGDSRYQLTGPRCDITLTVTFQKEDNNRKWMCQLTKMEQVKTSVDFTSTFSDIKDTDDDVGEEKDGLKQSVLIGLSMGVVVCVAVCVAAALVLTFRRRAYSVSGNQMPINPGNMVQANNRDVSKWVVNKIIHFDCYCEYSVTVCVCVCVCV